MRLLLAVPAYRRTLTAILFALCVVLATALALLAPQVFVGAAPGGPSPAQVTATSVTVFGENAPPRVAEAPSEAAQSGDATPTGTAPTTSDVSATAVDPGDTTSRTEQAGVFSEGVAPTTPVDPDRESVELGMRFTPKVDGSVSAIRFFATASNRGPHVGTLWGPSGEVLARVTFPQESSEGWQTAQLSPAVSLTAGSMTTVSYLAPNGRYAVEEHFFDERRDTAHLSVPVGAGVYAYGAGVYPDAVYRNSNYFVDVSFRPDVAAPETTASPEPTASADPSASPGPVTSPQPPSPAPEAGVFGGDAAPQRPVDPDRRSVELGMRFVPKVDGEATAIRFYRSAADSAALPGTLWDASGTRLGSVTFTGGGEGWQTAEFPRAVPLRAGSTYVVSYFARSGQYSADEHYFDVGIENDYFSVPVGAGVYAYGTGSFPTETYRNSNYYVDVRFSPVSAAPPLPEPSSSASPTPTGDPTTTPSPTPRPGPTTPAGSSLLDLPVEPWWGGADYYRSWPKATEAGWADPSFFPISVFFGKPSHAESLSAIGVNTYMGAEHDGSSLSTVTGQGISVLAQSEWTPQEVGDDPLVVGWHVSDECEMGYSGCAPEGDEYDRLAVQQRFAGALRSLDDGRFLQANFGNGVLGTWWGANTMDDHLALVDVSSVDKYAYTSPHVQGLYRSTPSWPSAADPASSAAYGWQQDRMESYMNPPASKPNWVFVETAMPYLTEDGATTISGEQIEGAAWNGLIHGAAGIAYFQHNNNGQCGNYSLVECGEALRAKVASINESITALAPVLNSPSFTWTFGPQLATSLKAHGGYAYILAMTDGGTGERTFTLPAGVAGDRVEVVGENRTLEVADGIFRDDFAAEHEHHIYRIPLS